MERRVYACECVGSVCVGAYERETLCLFADGGYVWSRRYTFRMENIWVEPHH